MKRLYIQSSSSNNLFSLLRSLGLRGLVCMLTLSCLLSSVRLMASESREESLRSGSGTTSTYALNTSSSIPIGKGNFQLTMIFNKFSDPGSTMPVKVEGNTLIDDLRKYQPSDKNPSFSVTKVINVSDGNLNIEYGSDVEKVLMTMLFKSTTAEADPISTEPSPAPEPSASVSLASFAKTSYTEGEAITMTANYEVSNDKVNSVSFYANNSKIGQVTPESGKTSTSYTWNSASAGTYSIKAVISTSESGSVASSTRSITVKEQTSDAPSATSNGVNYEFYIGEWGMLPRFNRVTVRDQGVINNFSLSPRDRNDFFAFRFNSYIKIEKSGEYTFYTKSDDGSQLRIDNEVIVDNNGLHGLQEKSGKIYLTAGLHPIMVTYFERTGKENLYVSYAGPGISKQIIPDAVLFIDGDGGSSSTAPVANKDEQFNINLTSGLTHSDWNNFSATPVAGQSIKLKNTDGSSTNVSVKLDTDWNEAKDKGYSTGIYPEAVNKTYFYTTGTETMTISGLTTGQAYDFTFYAGSAYGGNRTTEFIIGSKSVSINAAYNKSNTVSLNSIQPDSQGKVTLTVKKASGATYAFFNAMVIKTSGSNARTLTTSKKAVVNTQATNVPVQTTVFTPEATELKLYPVPASTQINVVFPQDAIYSIFNTKGQTIKTGVLEKLVPNTIALQGFKRGIYYIKILSDKGGISKKFIVNP